MECALARHSVFGRGHTAVLGGGRIFYVEEGFRQPPLFGLVDLATGRRLWRVAGPVSTMGAIVANDRHLVGLTENDVLELDAKSGKALWRARRESYAGGAVLVGDRLVYAAAEGSLAAVDLLKHREVWRKRFPVGLNAGYAEAAAQGGTGVFPGDDGTIFGVAASDGRTLWRQASGQGKNLYVRPMGDATLVVGGGYSALRTRDGKRLWRTEAKPGEGAAYLPRLGEVWALGLDGRLGRVSAATGRTLSLASLTGESGDALDGVKPYGKAFLLAKREKLLRLDESGKATASFDPQETVFDLFTLGPDVVMRTDTRLVRLSPGTSVPSTSLSGLLAKAVLTPEERRAVVRRGPEAVPPLIAAYEKASGARRQALAELLAQAAGAVDSLAVLGLVERSGGFQTSPDRSLRPLFRWLDEKGDRESLADAASERFRATKEADVREQYLGLLVRGTHDPVVDEMLRILHDPTSGAEWKGAVYASVGASGREDAREAVLAIRAQGRRLEEPNGRLSATADADGDGLPDAVDENPFVAPRALGDRERALAAAFDAFFRFSPMTDRVGLVRYPEGIRPFELTGWKATLVPYEDAAKIGIDPAKPSRGENRFAILEFRSHGGVVPTVQGGVDGRTATVDLGVLYGGRSGSGVRVTLRKFGDEWFSVGIREVWIT